MANPSEEIWLKSSDPAWMLRMRLGEHTMSVSAHSIQGWSGPTGRELRLFAQACAYKHVGPNFYKKKGGWVDWADRKSGEKEFTTLDSARWWCGIKVAQYDCLGVNTQTQEEFCSVMRDIMGNPFKPIEWNDCPENNKTVKHGGVLCVDHSIRTSGVLDVIEILYKTRENNRLDPGLLMALADELEDAGCPVESLGHQGTKRMITKDRKNRCAGCAGTGLVTRSSKFQRNIWHPCLLCRANQSPGFIEHLRSGQEHVYVCWLVEFLRNGDNE